MDFFINNIALIFLIIVSGFLLVFPKIISSNQKIVSIKEAVILMNRQPVNLVDVRSFDEYKKGRINNSINIPLDQLADNMDKLKKSPNKTLLLYCQKGFRSAQAVKILTKLGINSAISIEGGLDEWQKENLPIKMDS